MMGRIGLRFTRYAPRPTYILMPITRLTNLSWQASFSSEKFRKYHEHMQLFMLLYVEGSSYIDAEDDKWNIYTLCVHSFLKIYLGALVINLTLLFLDTSA
jgi:hypothetical protein